MKKTRFLVQAGLIAAVYAALTIVLLPISFSAVQFRVSEALTVLPFFTKAAVPGLFVGCLVANIYGGAGILDIVFGSLATLLAAYLTSKTKHMALAPFPPVIVNGLVIGTMLSYVFELPFAATVVSVSIGQLVVCYGLGYPLIGLLNIYRDKLFK